MVGDLIHGDDAFWCRWSVAEGAVRSHRVVVSAPLLDDNAGFLEGVEDLSIEQFVPETAPGTAEAVDDLGARQPVWQLDAVGIHIIVAAIVQATDLERFAMPAEVAERSHVSLDIRYRSFLLAKVYRSLRTLYMQAAQSKLSAENLSCRTLRLPITNDRKLHISDYLD
jgi:hypothetical protein